MRRLALILGLFILVTLGGCTPAGLGKLANFSSGLGAAGMNYVNTEVIGSRQVVRAKCWELLMEDVQELREKGKRSEARALLAEAYVSLTIMKAIEERDSSVLIEELNKPHACLVGGSPEEVPTEVQPE